MAFKTLFISIKNRCQNPFPYWHHLLIDFLSMSTPNFDPQILPIFEVEGIIRNRKVLEETYEDLDWDKSVNSLVSNTGSTIFNIYRALSDPVGSSSKFVVELCQIPSGNRAENCCAVTFRNPTTIPVFVTKPKYWKHTHWDNLVQAIIYSSNVSKRSWASQSSKSLR